MNIVNPANRWASAAACLLLITLLQGCLGGGGGSSSRSTAPTETATEQQVTTFLESPAQNDTYETSYNERPVADHKTPAAVDSDVANTRPGGPTTLPASGTGMLDLITMNIAGAEFTSSAIPGKNGTHYFFPKTGYLDTWSMKGIRTIRFPIKWERLQPELNGELDPTYAGLIDTLLTQAAQAEIKVVLDVHNYGRYHGNAIGGEHVSIPAYGDLIERIAKRYSSRNALYAYDIMNEPYGSADKHWPEAAQAGINAVRKHDRQRPIYIEGKSYSSAARWGTYGDSLLDLYDPYDNLVFSAHLYLDSDASGSYRDGDDALVNPMIGVNRARPFVEWLKKHNKRGHIGESGVPDDPRYLAAMDNLLAYLQQHCIPLAYWAAGPAWANHKLSAEPHKDGSDKAQWMLLEKYLGKGNCSDYGPN